MPIALILQDEYDFDHIPSESLFQIWINATEQALKQADNTPLEVTIRIVDEDQSAELNLAYRKKQGPTNVLSFPYDPIPGSEESLLGDLAICAPIVQQQADAQNKPLLAHWAHLTIHGILHLYGFDHIQEKEAEQMEQLEITILQALGFNNPYTEITE